ncbi:peptide chain release factor N(5)-glutamine methyltransferase [Candidatus Saccharibacteria bacterium]|nr:peptide chain release factor N(5)-glutamine methyltransferase [Candidatus Saccharibacteria bacterium]
MTANNLSATSQTTIHAWLSTAQRTISPLDAELILAHVLGQQRTFLHAHPDLALSTSQLSQADVLLKKRQNHTPLAYLIGKKSFYGRDFFVTPDVLIPRPETEAIISFAKTLVPPPRAILDIGTGSGCLAITLACEFPDAQVLACDISERALAIARKNAALHSASVGFVCSDLFADLPHDATYDLIVANLPYVDSEWSWLSPELAHEPKSALFAPDHGLALVKACLRVAPQYLKKNAFLVLEADLSQHAAIVAYAQAHAPQLEFIAQNDQNCAQNSSLALAWRHR